MKAVQFGVRVPNSGPLAGVENILQTARAAKQMGFVRVPEFDFRPAPRPTQPGKPGRRTSGWRSFGVVTCVGQISRIG